MFDGPTIYIPSVQKRDIVGNNADFKGLQQYLNELLYGDRKHAIREAGDLFGSIHVKVSGTWKEVTQPGHNVSGTWKNAVEAYVNVSGTWKKFWPDTVPFPSGTRVLGNSDISGGDWSEETSTYSAYWIFANGGSSYTSYGSKSGSNSHEHTLLPSTANAGTASRTAKTNATSTSSATNHSHSYNHTHGSVASYPARSDHRLFVATSESLVPAGAICFWNGLSTTVPSGWTWIGSDYTGYYPRIANGATGTRTGANYADHTHSGSWGSASSGSANNGRLLGGTRTNDWGAPNTLHLHSISLSAHSHSITQKYFDVVGIVADGAIGASPGVVVIYNSTSVPTGWTLMANGIYDGQLLRWGTLYGLTGGTSAHSHTHGSASVGTTDITAEYVRWTDGSGVYLYYHNHSHSAVTPTNHHEIGHTPQNFEAYLMEKSA